MKDDTLLRVTVRSALFVLIGAAWLFYGVPAAVFVAVGLFCGWQARKALHDV